MFLGTVSLKPECISRWPYFTMAVLSPFMMTLCVSIFAVWGRTILWLYSPFASGRYFWISKWRCFHFLTHRHPILKMFKPKNLWNGSGSDMNGNHLLMLIHPPNPMDLHIVISLSSYCFHSDWRYCCTKDY